MCSELEKSPYNRDTVMILCILGFLGFAGIHRLYVGRVASGILFFITGGWFCIGTIVDLYAILKNRFEDDDGRIISAE